MRVHPLFRQVGLVLALTTVGAVATAAFHPRRPAWYLVMEAGENAVTESAVRERWNGDVQWVDSRPAKAYQKRHRDGAILLNEEEWNDLLSPQVFDQLVSAGKPIVVYCDGSRCERSKAVAEKLQGIGLPEVYYLQGGWR